MIPYLEKVLGDEKFGNIKTSILGFFVVFITATPTLYFVYMPIYDLLGVSPYIFSRSIDAGLLAIIALGSTFILKKAMLLKKDYIANSQ